MNITPSHIIEALYCPRYIYFQYVLGIPQHEEVYYKAMKGREIHERKIRQNAGYLRERIGVKEKKSDVYLAYNNLRGIVDEVLFLRDGSASPLDYKFAVYEDKIFKTYRIQLHCYAYLIEKNFNVRVNNGYLVYIRSKNKLVTVPITGNDTKAIDSIIEEIYKIIDANKFPPATKAKSKCLTCTYRNLCVK